MVEPKLGQISFLIFLACTSCTSKPNFSIQRETAATAQENSQYFDYIIAAKLAPRYKSKTDTVSTVTEILSFVQNEAEVTNAAYDSLMKKMTEEFLHKSTTRVQLEVKVNAKIDSIKTLNLRAQEFLSVAEKIYVKPPVIPGEFLTYYNFWKSEYAEVPPPGVVSKFNIELNNGPALRARLYYLTHDLTRVLKKR